MLDNMDHKQLKESIESLKTKNYRERVLIEISGGINIKNLEKFLEFNPDIISSSKLTLFPNKVIDLSLRFD
jgi:nicotinate-nucleotide pyrophosphorylase (carboxylating)